MGSLTGSWLTRLCSAHPRADSVAWNPHKLLSTGLQCSALLLRDTSVGLPRPCSGPLESANSRRAGFLKIPATLRHTLRSFLIEIFLDLCLTSKGASSPVQPSSHWRPAYEMA